MTKWDCCCSVAAGDGEESCAAAGSSWWGCYTSHFHPFTVGTGHCICKTLTDWATQALFSVGFQVFRRPFWQCVPNSFRHYQKCRLSWGWLTKQKFQQSCHKYLKTSLLIQWNVWLAPIVNAFTENLTVRCHLGLVVSKNEKRLGAFLITFWYITKWLFF